MLDIQDLCERIYRNKIDKGFNTTHVPTDFAYLHGEVSEALDAWTKGRDTVGEELADVMIYTLGIARLLGVDLEHEILVKMEKNEKRRYERVDGVMRRVDDNER